MYGCEVSVGALSSQVASSRKCGAAYRSHKAGSEFHYAEAEGGHLAYCKELARNREGAVKQVFADKVILSVLCGTVNVGRAKSIYI